MKYPTITHSACKRLADLKIRGLEGSMEPEVLWVGNGDDLDLAPIQRAAWICTEMVAEKRDFSDHDQVEGALAGVIWNELHVLPVYVLDDPGFWRYLSLGAFWDFISWREERAFEAGNHLKYVDGLSSTESVLPRMYLRSAAVGGAEYATLAAGLSNATDFWRSHVIRVRTGTAPAVTREFVRSQQAARLKTQPLRELAKRVNRSWTNSVPQLLSEDDAKRLIQELRESLIGESSSD